MDHIIRSPKDIGHVLRQARKAGGLSQADLAAKAGLWQRTVSTLETGAADARLETLFDLLAALDLELQVVPRSRTDPDSFADLF
ncbi:helix-turn-helix domain-containing protein [Ketogulonicigenium vulgare]|nr:helix-turn-helix domain-containing protein [Ketogulonicigenium vulgare]ALJ82890.1 XRE family transcriptional regulator [Ketogulonicigenium vulgare]